MTYIRRRKRNRGNALNDLPLTPLIDTALTLLVIFMVTSPMVNNVIKISLPKGQAKEDVGSSAQDPEIYIDSNNVIHYGGSIVTSSELLASLKQKCTEQTAYTVIVKADENARYGSIIELIDDMKVLSGVEGVGLVTQYKHNRA